MLLMFLHGFISLASFFFMLFHFRCLIFFLQNSTSITKRHLTIATPVQGASLNFLCQTFDAPNVSYPNLFRLNLLEFPTATRRTREFLSPLENTIMRFGSWSSFPMWSCFLLAILASLSLAKREEEDATLLQRQVHRERADEANEAKTPPGLDQHILGQIFRFF